MNLLLESKIWDLWIGAIKSSSEYTGILPNQLVSRMSRLDPEKVACPAWQNWSLAGSIGMVEVVCPLHSASDKNDDQGTDKLPMNVWSSTQSKLALTPWKLGFTC